MKKINNQTIKSFLFLGIIALITSCGSDSEVKVKEEEHGSNEVEFTQAQYKNAGIELGSIELRTLSNTLRVNGMIDAPPQNLISISAPLGGYVVSTDLVTGMKVRKGQKLVTIEHQEYIQLQQDYLDKKSQLEYLESEFKRQSQLRNENVNSEKVFQQSNAQYKSMKAQVNGIKEKLSYVGINVANLNENNISRRVTIFAPANGFVSKMNINIGKYCNPTDVLIELIDTEHLHSELTVFEKDLGKIKMGQKINLTSPSAPNEIIKAEVYLIGHTIDTDRSVKVHAHFDKDYPFLAPGMYVNATVETDENKVNSVPENSVLFFDDKNYIAVLEGIQEENGKKMNHFSLIEIRKGVSENGFTEIELMDSNLDLSQLKVVTKGAYSILATLKNSEDGGGHAH